MDRWEAERRWLPANTALSLVFIAVGLVFWKDHDFSRAVLVAGGFWLVRCLVAAVILHHRQSSSSH